MNLDIASRQIKVYSVQTPVYQGPLDLLLQLIERTELDITKLALAQVTTQYLSFLHQVETQAPEEVSAFLVIAAKLLQIKSEALLPRPPSREPGEEDPAESLARQLMIYKRYKEIAATLSERQKAGLRTYLRLSPPPKVHSRLDLEGISLADLVEAAQEVFFKSQSVPLNTVVQAPKITIRQKIRLISATLRHRGKTSFRSLLGNKFSRLDVVVTFLAMLELVKCSHVTAQQDSLFGSIELHAEQSLTEEADFELEFGE